MTLEIKRLHLASLQGPDGGTWPVHGFVVTHPGGAVLVDTGVGGPQDLLDDWRVANRSVANPQAWIGLGSKPFSQTPSALNRSDGSLALGKWGCRPMPAGAGSVCRLVIWIVTVKAASDRL